MHLNCPQCQSRIDLSQHSNTAESIKCATCGSTLRVANIATEEYKPSFTEELGDKFELLSVVGQGAFGTVYRARDLSLGRTVAVKVPRRGMWADDSGQARFLREARSAAQLRHPSIVPVHEVGQADGVPYLVSEYIEGMSLADFLTGKRLPMREAVELVAVLAEALHHAHTQGVVHRDVKPSNIMLDSRQSPYLMDFGLAKRDAGEITMTLEGQVLGTPAYLSPEQAKGEGHTVDGRSNVYSLGVILYQLLTGELPFRGNTRMLLHQVLNDEPRPPRSLNDQVPRDLDTICLKCLRKAPAKRYATAKALAEDLRRYLAGEPIHARPVGKLERGGRWVRRHPAPVALSIALVVVFALGFAGAVWLWQKAEDHLAEVGKQKQQADDNLKLANAKSKEADENFQQALQTVDKFTTVIEDKLLSSPVSGMQPLSSELLQSALQYYKGFVAQRGQDPSLRFDLAKAHYYMGFITRQIGSQEDAVVRLGEAVAQLDALHQAEPENAKVPEMLANACVELARAQSDTGHAALAVQSAERALSLLPAPAKEAAGDSPLRYRRARAYHALGNAERARNQPKEALSAFHKALETYRSGPRPTSVRARVLLVRTHYDMATANVAIGRTASAQESLEQALALLDELTQAAPNDLDVRILTANCFSSMGDVLSRQHEPQRAIAYLERALAVREDLARQNPAVTNIQNELAATARELGRLYQQQARPHDSLRVVLKVLPAQQKLVRDNPRNAYYRQVLAMIYSSAGSALASLDQPLHAEHRLRQALGEQTSLSKEEPDNLSYRNYVSLIQERLAGVENRFDRKLASAKLLREAAAIRRKLIDSKSPLADTPAGEARFQEILTQANKAVKDAEAALTKVGEQVAELTEKLDQEPALDDVRQELLAKLHERGQLQRGLGQTALAVRSYEDSIQHSAKLVADYPSIAKFRHKLVETYLDLAYLHQENAKENKRSKDAVLTLDKALTAAEKVGNPKGIDHYLIGCLRAQQAAVLGATDDTVPEDKKAERQKYLELAMKSLSQAVADGFSDAARWRRELSLDPLRDREDFQKLIAGMKK